MQIVCTRENRKETEAKLERNMGRKEKDANAMTTAQRRVYTRRGTISHCDRTELDKEIDNDFFEVNSIEKFGKLRENVKFKICKQKNKKKKFAYLSF